MITGCGIWGSPVSQVTSGGVLWPVQEAISPIQICALPGAAFKPLFARATNPASGVILRPRMCRVSIFMTVPIISLGAAAGRVA